MPHLCTCRTLTQQPTTRDPMTQRVLVTAGANGIGLAVARSFTGAQVHVAYIDASAVASVLHGRSQRIGDQRQ